MRTAFEIFDFKNRNICADYWVLELRSQKIVYFCGCMMTKDDMCTLKAALLYIIEKSDASKCDVYGIVKTAFFAQQIHLAKFGCPLFNDDICALQFGPVPSNVYDVLKIARGDQKELSFHMNDGLTGVSASIGWDSERYSAKEHPNMDFLSPSDIQSLDEAITKVSKMDFNSLRDNTHGKEWNRAFKSGVGKKVMNTLVLRSSDQLKYREAWLSAWIQKV